MLVCLVSYAFLLSLLNCPLLIIILGFWTGSHCQEQFLLFTFLQFIERNLYITSHHITFGLTFHSFTPQPSSSQSSLLPPLYHLIIPTNFLTLSPLFPDNNRKKRTQKTNTRLPSSSQWQDMQTMLSTLIKQTQEKKLEQAGKEYEQEQKQHINGDSSASESPNGSTCSLNTKGRTTKGKSKNEMRDIDEDKTQRRM